MERHFFLRRNIARLVLRAVRWKTAGTVPRRGILVGAPHTSNWDWVLTLLLAWDNSVQIRLLVKDSFFKGPIGVFMRATGAVELDRANPGATIRALLEDSETDETFLLGIAAEGTRSKGEYWKSGFYRISQQTGIPITLAFLDAPSRTVGWGPTFTPTGDVAADMDRIREFFADKRGLKPELTTVPRLKEEDSAGGGTRTLTP
jgi:1-acyl-sn-glycerol-3-phosphate acyltransferase